MVPDLRQPCITTIRIPSTEKKQQRVNTNIRSSEPRKEGIEEAVNQSEQSVERQSSNQKRGWVDGAAIRKGAWRNGGAIRMDNGEPIRAILGEKTGQSAPRLAERLTVGAQHW